MKAKEERRNTLPPQLPAPLQEPRLRSFPDKNNGQCRMTGTEAAVAAEANTARVQRKSEKELETSRNVKPN